MSNTIAISDKRAEMWKTIIIDTLAVSAMYFMPSAAHMLSFPLYLLEPIRLLIILALVHTNRNNAFALALTLPLFSFIVSGHPVLFKMLIITTEMTLNVFLFYIGLKLIQNKFLSMVGAIVLSKVFYYIIEYFMLQAALIPTGLGDHPILLQVGLVVVVSLYVLVFFKEEAKK